jgi:hypothetical protein
MYLISLSRRYLFLLAVSIQLHLASAGCSNFTFLTYAVELGGDPFTTFRQQVDVVSCPSSLNHSCQIPPRNYNITVPTQLNVSSHQYFNNTYASDYDGEGGASYYNFNQSSDISDSESIFKFIADYHAPKYPGGDGFDVNQSPLEVTVNTYNLSKTQRIAPLSLNVTSGYSMTLFYKPYMIYTWATFSGCDNATLDGFPMEVTTGWGPQGFGNGTVWPAGLFEVEGRFLNDSVPKETKNAGLGLSMDRAWMGTLVALAVLGVMVL